MGYLDPALLDDETAVAEGILAAQADQIEGWDANEGDVETAAAESVGMVAAAIAATFMAQLKERFANGLIRDVLGLPRIAAIPASVEIEITMATDAGYRIPAGFGAVLETSTGDEIDFATTQDLVIPQGQTIGSVRAEALEPGVDGNGAFGSAVDFDRLVDVVAVTAPTPSGSGADEESVDDYIDRGIKHLRRINPVPGTPQALAIFALDIPGVARALPLNRTNPDDPGADAPGHVTIVAADADGAALQGGVLAALVAFYAQLELIMGCVVHVVGPDDVPVTIEATVKPAAGVTNAAAEAAAETRLGATLASSVWAYDADADTRWTPRQPQLGVFDIAALIDDLPELASVTEVKINGATAAITVPVTGLVRATSIDVTAA